MFCWMDRWYGLTIEDIRRIEEEVQHELNKVKNNNLNLFFFINSIFKHNLYSFIGNKTR